MVLIDQANLKMNNKVITVVNGAMSPICSITLNSQKMYKFVTVEIAKLWSSSVNNK